MMPFLLIPLTAWLVAQIGKYILQSVQLHSLRNTKALVASGGMPSSHAALVVALVVTVGAIEGIESAAFGIAAIMAAVILYDAINVRRAVGEQGTILQQLTKSPFFNAKGHTIVELTIGCVIGVVVATCMLRFL